MQQSTIVQKLVDLRLAGAAEQMQEQGHKAMYASMAFEDRLGLILDAEESYRNNRRYKLALRKAKLKVSSSADEIDFKSGRGLDKSLVLTLLKRGWIEDAQNLLITGQTGTGKTFLACALATKAAQNGYKVLYKRVPRLMEEFERARNDGTIIKERNALSRQHLLILDDFGLGTLTNQGKVDLLEVLDDRVGTTSTIVLGQMPVKDWYAYINEPALADAIMDRLYHSSHRIELKGESMRKAAAKKRLTGAEDSKKDQPSPLEPVLFPESPA